MQIKHSLDVNNEQAYIYIIAKKLKHIKAQVFPMWLGLKNLTERKRLLTLSLREYICFTVAAKADFRVNKQHISHINLLYYN